LTSLETFLNLFTVAAGLIASLAVSTAAFSTTDQVSLPSVAYSIATLSARSTILFQIHLPFGSLLAIGLFATYV